MKASLSIAVLALVGELSASELSRHHHHRHHQQKPHSFIQKKMLPLTSKPQPKIPIADAEPKGHYYPETASGREWFELDDFTERLHGTEAEDNNSPHDPDVVDAPEDMKRVENDHEDLHNAKLSPDGYYNGFHHKDFQGKFAQVKSYHKNNRHQRSNYANDKTYLSYKENNLVNYEHENDTEDIPEGQDPISLVQNMRGTAQKRFEEDRAWAQFFQKAGQQAKEQQNEDEWDKLYAQEEDEKSYEYVMYDHENDTEDVPDGLDPIALVQRVNKSDQELLVEKEDQKLQSQSDEIQNIMDQQAKEDAQHIQIDSDINMPHEDDTDDIAVDVTPSTYDKKHSKAWNQLVEKRAQEIENQIKIQENTQKAQERAEKEAKEKAALEIKRQADEKAKAKQEQERKIKEQRDLEAKRTIDLSYLYKDLPADQSIVQIGDSGVYEHHSKYWQEMVDKRTQELSDSMEDQEEKDAEEVEQLGRAEVPKKTINLNELYNDITLQTRYEHHSNAWYDRVESMEKEMEESKQSQLTQSKKAIIEQNGMTPVIDDYVHHPNPSVNFGEMYADLVQIKYDHEDDTDDFVPEFSDPVAVEIKKDENKVHLKKDFNGQNYEEFYDE